MKQYCIFIGILLLSIIAGKTGRAQGKDLRLVLPIGNTSYIDSIEYLPSEKRVISYTQNETKVFDRIAQKELFSLPGRKFIKQQNTIVTTLNDTTFTLWDVTTGLKLSRFAPGIYIRDVILSRDGRRVLLQDNIFQFWSIDLDNPQAKKQITYRDTSEMVGSLDDNRKLLIRSFTGKGAITTSIDTREYQVALLDVVTGMRTGLEGAGQYQAWRINEAGQSAAGVLNDSLGIWNIQSGKLLQKTLVPKDYFNSTRPSFKLKIPDFFVDLADKKEEYQEAIRALELREVQSWSPDSTIFIVPVSDGLEGWDVRTRQVTYKVKLPFDAYGLQTGRFSTTGEKFYANYYTKLYVIEVATGKIGLDASINVPLNHIQFIENGSEIMVADDLNIRIYDCSTGQLAFNFEGKTPFTYSLRFSPSNEHLVTTHSNGKVQLWGSAHFDPQNNLTLINDQPLDALFTPDNQIILIRTKLHNIVALDSRTLEILYTVQNDQATNEDRTAIYDIQRLDKNGTLATKFQLSRDGTLLLVNHDYQKCGIYDTKTGKIKYKLLPGTEGAFSANDNRIITRKNRYSYIWDTINGILLDSLPEYEVVEDFRKEPARIFSENTTIFKESMHYNTPGASNPDPFYFNNRSFEIAGRDILIRNLENGFPSFLQHADYINDLKISPDTTRVLSASDDHFAKLWDIKTSKVLQQFDHGGKVGYAEYSPNGKQVFTNGQRLFKVWDAGSGKLQYTFIPMEDENYMILNPDGFYMATPNAAKLLYYVTRDLKTISFEQLDVRYNRPDKVLQAMGSRDTALINSYRKAYEKRIKRLGIDTSTFKPGYSVPQGDFENRKDIRHEQKSGSLKLRIKATDSVSTLDRFNIWINKIPLFGANGMSLSRSTHVLDTAINVQLAEGYNTIEMSVRNVNGLESYRVPLKVNFRPEQKITPKTYFIGIGIEKFSKPGYDLKYSVKDIRDLAKALKSKLKDDFVLVDTLFNARVTTRNIQALKKLLMATSVDDKVIISFSGHGLLSRSSDYYLSTYNTNFMKPQDKGLPIEILEGLLDGIPARKKLLLIDACHSGEFDKEERSAVANTTNRREVNQVIADARGISPEIVKSTLKTGSSFELMKFLFVNVAQGTGATIISASGGMEYALERDDLKNGVFTFAVLETLEKENLTVNELRNKVISRVTELTAGAQKPTSRTESSEHDWTL